MENSSDDIGGGTPVDEDLHQPPPMTFEAVFAEPLSLNALMARVEERLGGGHQVEPVFAPDDELDGEDDHFFITVPDLPTDDSAAPQIFERCRLLQEVLSAAEVNPLMIDSLYGATAFMRHSIRSGICSTPETAIQPIGRAHDKIDTLAGWSVTMGAGATVAVIDTGTSTHDELDQVFTANGTNLVENNNNPADLFTSDLFRQPGHGTTVASVVASRGGLTPTFDTTGPGEITGVAPDAKLLPIRTITSVIYFTQRRIPKAIGYAVAQGADVIIMALGGPTRISSVEKALRQAVAEGVIIVCAAGNCYPSVVFPARYARYGLTTSVAAVTEKLDPWRFTGKGAANVIAAPGENVWSATKSSATDPDHATKPSQGTTLASSMTAGAAALWSASLGGRTQVKAIAAGQGTTGQVLFNAAVTATAKRPPSWGSQTDLGAGVLNLGGLFAGGQVTNQPPILTATPPVAPAPWGSIPTSLLAQELLAEIDIRVERELSPETTEALAPFAAELIWRSYRAGSRERASVEMQRLAQAEDAVEVRAMPPASPSLETFLADRPLLRQMVDAD